MAPDDIPRLSRRDLLRGCGATATALSAGCSGLPPLGSSIRYGAVDAPPADPPSYRTWLPAPAALPGEQTDTEDVMVYAPPPADAPAWTRSGVARGVVTFQADYLGVDIDEVGVAFATGWGAQSVDFAALTGEVDPSVIRETVGQTSYEPVATDADYDRYERTDSERAVGVLPEGLVFATGPDARAAIDSVVAAGRGEAPRAHERDANFDLLTRRAGTRRWAWLWPGGVEESSDDAIREDTVGWATAFDHADGSAYFVQTWVFPPAYDLTAGKVKRALKAESRAGLPNATDAGAVDVTVDGRVATIEMQVAPSKLREADAEAFLVPFVTWSATGEQAADRLTFHHEAGDPVRTDWLRVAGLGEGESAVNDRELGDRMTAGESLTVSTAGAESGATVRLVYQAPDGDRSATLFTHDLP